VAPLSLMCDPRDIAVWPEVKSPATGTATIFMYERVPGGVGFSERLYRMHGQLLANAGGLIGRCGCEWGCPSCVGAIDGLTSGSARNAKLCSLQILGVLFDEVRPSRESSRV
jgi:DEAD/DEAH box helicase domain-containing protein